MEIGLILLGGFVVFGAIVVYVILMIFFPEWVGITGKVALKNEESHKVKISEAEPENSNQKID